MSADLSQYKILGERIICRAVAGEGQIGEVAKVGGDVQAGRCSPGNFVYFSGGVFPIGDGLFVIREEQILVVGATETAAKEA